MYYKGANMLHTIRQLVNDDEKWRNILRGLNKDFYHQTVNTKQIEDYISEKANLDLSSVFDQYLRTTEIPTFTYTTEDEKLTYRWENCVSHFDMKVQVIINGKNVWLAPTTSWKTEMISDKITSVEVDEDFYVRSKDDSE